VGGRRAAEGVDLFAQCHAVGAPVVHVAKSDDDVGDSAVLEVAHAIDAAREFYHAVFGWDYDIGGPEYGGYTTARLGQAIKAFVVPRNGFVLSEKDVMKHCKKELERS
jgi:hypothetical protein